MNVRELLGENLSTDMSAEDLMALIEKTEVPEDKSKAVEEHYKGLISKANSEAAEYKKQLKAKMTESEQKSAEEAEAQARLKKDYDALLEKVTIAEHKSQFIALGYTEETAEAAAKALYSGDVAKVFELQKAHQEEISKKANADYIDGQPKPKGGQGNSPTMTKEQIMAIQDPTERWEAIAQNSSLFPELG